MWMLVFSARFFRSGSRDSVKIDAFNFPIEFLISRTAVALEKCSFILIQALVTAELWPLSSGNSP